MTQKEIWKQFREEARSKGLKTYIGRPCIHGHGNKRYVVSDTCKECNRIGASKYRKTNKKDALRRTKEWYIRNKDRIKEKQKILLYKNFQIFEKMSYGNLCIISPFSSLS